MALVWGPGWGLALGPRPIFRRPRWSCMFTPPRRPWPLLPLLQELGSSLHGGEGSGWARAGGEAGGRGLVSYLSCTPGPPREPPEPSAVHDRSS